MTGGSGVAIALTSAMSLSNVNIQNLGSTSLKIGLILAGLILVLWFASSWREAHNLRVDKHTITHPDVPRELDGATIAFAADIHAGPLFGPIRVRELVRAIDTQSPDAVILGGDYVGGRRGGASAFYPEIAELSAPRGVYAVLGNHDVWEGIEDARDGFAASNITLLENDVVRIGDPGNAIVIGGLDDEWTGEPDAHGMATEIAEGEFAVLVAHNPDSFDTALDDESPWRLALAGHTHGGQVRGFYSILTHKPTKFGARYLGGWTNEHDTPILVSNGVGSVTLPLRTLAPAEIHIITLRRG